MTQSAPPIVTICGSMRFFEHMLTVAAEETAQGRIVLAPFSVVAPEDQAGELKTMLDELHLRKIDMAEWIVVVTNQDGYIGESTRREMTYALRAGKKVNVREFRTDPVVIDGRRMVGAGHATTTVNGQNR